MKNYIGLQYIQNKSLQPQKVRHHALLKWKIVKCIKFVEYMFSLDFYIGYVAWNKLKLSLNTKKWPFAKVCAWTAKFNQKKDSMTC